MSSTKYTLIKLNSSNFGIWFQTLSAAFEGEDLDDLLLPSTVKPEDNADAKTRKEFKTRQGKAKSILFAALDPPDLEQVILQPTVYLMVQSLKGRFDRSVSEYSIMDEIHRCKWNRGETVDIFLNKLSKLKQQAKDKNMHIDDNLFIHKIVNQLPPFMSGLQTSYKVDLAKGTALQYDTVCMAVKKYFDEVFDPHHNDRSNRHQPSMSLLSQSYGHGHNKPKKWCPLHKSRFHSKEECRRIKRLNGNGYQNQQLSTHQSASSTSNGNRNGIADQQSDLAAPALAASQPIGQSVQPAQSPVDTASSPSIEIPSVFGMSVIDRDEQGRSFDWLFDSACSNVMSPFADDFRDLKHTPNGRSVKTANGPTQVLATGDIQITSFNGEQHIPMSFKEAYYVPSLPARLFSEPLARKAGLSVSTVPATGELQLRNRKNQVIFTGSATPYSDEIFRMNICVVKSDAVSCVTFSEAHLHGAWGHCPPRVIHDTIDNDLVSEISVNQCDHSCKCEVCIQATTQCKPHKGNLIKCKIPGKIVHCDSYTPNLKSYAQLGTAFIFVDEATGYKSVQLARDKTFPRVKAAFAAYLTYQKRILGTHPIEFHADNGTEFTSDALKLFLNERNSSISHSTPYHKQQNGVAEAAVKQLINTTTAILLSSNLPIFLWNRLFITAARLLNIRYKRSIETSPYKAFHGQSAIVSHFRPIGTRAHAHVPSEKRRALQARTQIVFLVDYTDSQNLFFMYNPRSKQIEQHFKPTFIENSIPIYKVQASAGLPAKSTSKASTTKPSAAESEHVTVEVEFESAVQPYLPSNNRPFRLPSPDEDRQASNGENTDSHRVSNDFSFANNLFDPEDAESTVNAPEDRSDDDPEESSGDVLEANSDDLPKKRTYTRKIYQKVNRNLRSNSASNDLSALIVMPISDPSNDIWEQPRIEEMNSQIANGTWTLEQPPLGANIIRCDFVYGYKYDPLTKKLCPKAGLVAKGYAQQFGIDFFETYAPTMSSIGLKMILCMIIQLNLAAIQFDVKTAFLNSPLKEIIYMIQPPHFNDGTGRVCRLRKSIYGLKQAARDWYNELKSTLIDFGFRVIDSEQCVFLFTSSNIFTIIGIYVDDGVAASNAPSELDRLIAYLSTKYTMKVGPLNKFIGLEIEQTEGKFHLHQRQYIEKVLALYGMSDSKPISTPAPKGYPISHNDLYDPTIHSAFRSVVASLQYLARTSRPDIAFIVGALATKLECPSAADFGSAKRVLRYLATTLKLSIEFAKASKLTLTGFCDANYGVEPRGLSRTGAIIELFGNPIGWWSKLQTIPARSSTR